MLLVAMKLISFNPRTHTGCDPFRFPGGVPGYCFNPRTHTGCDTDAAEKVKADAPVSIHAPTRGATFPNM